MAIQKLDDEFEKQWNDFMERAPDNDGGIFSNANLVEESQLLAKAFFHKGIIASTKIIIENIGKHKSGQPLT